MKLKTKNISNNSSRHKISLRKNLLSKYNSIIKNLQIYNFNSAGRNNNGHITVRHQGGGCKKKNHIFEKKNNIYKGIVLCKMYNSKANSFVSLNFDFKKQIFFKTVSIKNHTPGSLIKSSLKMKEIKLGFRTILEKIPLGTLISLVTKNFITKYSKSSGTFSQIIEKKKNQSKLRLPSGNTIILSSNELATFGVINNIEYKNLKIGKAGINRLKGIRPSVRGIAMNPVDHPHGGKSNKGKPPVTPWGVPTKNKPTRKKKL